VHSLLLIQKLLKGQKVLISSFYNMLLLNNSLVVHASKNLKSLLKVTIFITRIVFQDSL